MAVKGRSGRRVVLLAVATASASLFCSGMIPRVDILPAAYAQALQPQFGFADIVDKIKPAVISVSVRLNEGADTGARGVAPQESPLERFFRRFAQPDDDSAPLLPRNTLMRQGSGFFITADGYAVTNNHVVEGVSTVEVKTDAGKIYTAKVVGADRRTDVALIKVERPFRFSHGEIRRAHTAGWRLGAGGRQSVWARGYRDGRHRVGTGARHRIERL